LQWNGWCSDAARCYFEGMDFIIEHWAELLIAVMAFGKAVANILPSENPRKVFAYLDLLVDAIIKDNTTKKN